MILLSFVVGYWLLERSITSGRSGSPRNGCERKRIRYASGVLCLSLPGDIAHNRTLKICVWNRHDTYQSFSDTFRMLSCEWHSCRKMPDSGHGVRGVRSTNVEKREQISSVLAGSLTMASSSKETFIQKNGGSFRAYFNFELNDSGRIVRLDIGKVQDAV
jgi:hypothetical protein